MRSSPLKLQPGQVEMSHFICYTSGGITLHPCSDFWSLFNEHSKGISSQCVERYCGMANCAVHFASLVFVFFFVINTWRKSRRWATIQSEGSARFIMLSSAFRSMKSCFLVPVKHCVLLISLTVWCAHPQWTTRSPGERLMLEFSALGLMFTAPSKVEWQFFHIHKSYSLYHSSY